jgi:hypothetical protein
VTTPATEKHRQIAYLVEFAHPITRDRDADLFFGEYTDAAGHRIGRLLRPRHDPESTNALLVPDEEVPLMHVQASLDADHLVTSFGMVVALIYRPEETPPEGVVESGDRWDAGDMRIYLFEDDEAAALARGTV